MSSVSQPGPQPPTAVDPVPLMDGRRRVSRAVAEAPDPLRSPFHSDRDRILRSKAFRRLGAKTQVFIAPEGDHYRTRLTHTLAVAAIARTAARALGLDEDLTEAIALGHDLGHAPFGHTGERALDSVLSERCGRHFRHNEQSLRTVDVLELNGRGLNLTDAVRDGILHHTGPQRPATLEGQIVKLADRFAYVNHDIDDAIRAGVIGADDLPGDIINELGHSSDDRVDTLLRDLIAESADGREIRQSSGVATVFSELRGFMFDNVYLGHAGDRDRRRVEEFLPRLVELYLDEPAALPEAYVRSGGDHAEHVADFIAGMTDRYCLRMMREAFLPREWRLDDEGAGADARRVS